MQLDPPSGTSTRDLRTALVIAVNFPPLANSGVQRTLKFVKYLPEFGWRAAVLTGDPEAEGAEPIDRTLLDEIPAGTEIDRIGYCNPAERMFSVVGRLRRGRRSREDGAAPSPPVVYTEAPARAGFLKDTFRRIRRSLVSPVGGDSYYYWSRRVRRPALNLIRRLAARIVYVSASPFASLLLGLWLKRRTGLPFVADFRDFWTTFFADKRGRPMEGLNRYLERKVLRGADVVICNHGLMREEFERIEPRCRGKCEVITNGYDPADFEGLPPARPQDCLAHVGVSWEDAPHPVLRGLAEMKNREQIPAGFKVRFVGGLPPSSLAMVGELGLTDVVSIEGRVSHHEAIEIMRSAGALLLLPGAKALAPAIPGKFFEYLAAARPILCISPTLLTANLVRETGCGLVLQPEDSARIAGAIAELARDPEGWAAVQYQPRQEVIERFSRRRLTARLAEIFDRLVAAGAKV